MPPIQGHLNNGFLQYLFRQETNRNNDARNKKAGGTENQENNTKFDIDNYSEFAADFKKFYKGKKSDENLIKVTFARLNHAGGEGLTEKELLDQMKANNLGKSVKNVKNHLTEGTCNQEEQAIKSTDNHQRLVINSLVETSGVKYQGGDKKEDAFTAMATFKGDQGTLGMDDVKWVEKLQKPITEVPKSYNDGQRAMTYK